MKAIVAGTWALCSAGFFVQLASGAAEEAKRLDIEKGSTFPTGDLRKWVGENFGFFKDASGKSRAFIRRQPIKAFLYPSSFVLSNDVAKLIARLSAAAGVSYELTSRDINLAIVVDTPINDGDKPNPVLWSKFGFTSEMYNIVASAESWASGCGAYSFGTRQGQIGLSIVFADTKLTPSDLRDCVNEGVIRAFGLHQQSGKILHADDGYAPYERLVEALHSCEEKLGGAEELAAATETDQKTKYLDCATEFLSKRK